MARDFCIWIVTIPDYPHSRCFEEVALTLSEAFAALGTPAPIVTRSQDVRGTTVVLGAHLLAENPQALPGDLILYNLEQAAATPGWMNSAYVALLRRYPVWDYSARNVAALAQAGVVAALCGIGYMPGLTRIAPAPVQDIDVLFIGSTNPRRQFVLDDLAARGVRVARGFNVYGAERDAAIARARIVLNLHFYQSKLFEIVRVSYLLANRVCVVSESGNDPELEAPLAAGVAFAPYDGLADMCVKLLADDAARARIAQKGFACMRALSQVEMLRRALSPPQP